MSIEEFEYENEKYYYINEQECKYGVFSKFANSKATIFCTKKDGNFEIVKNKKILRALNKDIKKFEIKDII